jgi:hypothetical protein
MVAACEAVVKQGGGQCDERRGASFLTEVRAIPLSPPSSTAEPGYSAMPFWPRLFSATARVVAPLPSTIFVGSAM